MPVPDRGYRLALVEPGTDRDRLIKPVRAQHLAKLGHQLGLRRPQHRPGPQAHPLAQAIGGAFQQRRPLRVALPEREPGMCR